MVTTECNIYFLKKPKWFFLFNLHIKWCYWYSLPAHSGNKTTKIILPHKHIEETLIVPPQTQKKNNCVRHSNMVSRFWLALVDFQLIYMWRMHLKDEKAFSKQGSLSPVSRKPTVIQTWSSGSNCLIAWHSVTLNNQLEAANNIYN